MRIINIFVRAQYSIYFYFCANSCLNYLKLCTNLFDYPINLFIYLFIFIKPNKKLKKEKKMLNGVGH